MEDNKTYFHITESSGTISISPDVIAGIAADACLETRGIASMTAAPQPSSRGVAVSFAEDSCAIEAYVMVRTGFVIADVAKEAQKNIKSAVEAGCGITVSQADVFVSGIEMKN